MVSCRPFVIPRNFGFGLYLICCLPRYRVGRHLATYVFVVKKENSDFWADSSILDYVLQLVSAYSPFCSLDVALSKCVSCVHNASSSTESLTCGAPTAGRLCMSMPGRLCRKGEGAATGSIPV